MLTPSEENRLRLVFGCSTGRRRKWPFFSAPSAAPASRTVPVPTSPCLHSILGHTVLLGPKPRSKRSAGLRPCHLQGCLSACLPRRNWQPSNEGLSLLIHLLAGALVSRRFFSIYIQADTTGLCFSQARALPMHPSRSTGLLRGHPLSTSQQDLHGAQLSTETPGASNSLWRLWTQWLVQLHGRESSTALLQARGQPAASSRLPRVGQKKSWQASPGSLPWKRSEK